MSSNGIGPFFARGAGFIVIVLFALAGCSDSSSTTTPSTTGTAAMTAFTLSGFRGESMAFTADVTHVERVNGPCGEIVFTGVSQRGTWLCMTSLQLSTGKQVTVYALPDFQGPSTTFVADVPDLRLVDGPCGSTWHHCIRSFRFR